MSEWVNVKDGVPEIGDVDGLEVLITVKEGTETSNSILGHMVIPALYYEREKWYPFFMPIDDEVELTSEVEAWMYYPEPYKGANDEEK